MNKISIHYNANRYTKEQNDAMERALDYAAAAHEGQTRQSGEPYIVHPVAVAELVAEWGLDYEAVQAALLHDVVEDTPITRAELAEAFGDKVAELVDGVTKLRLRKLPGLSPDSVRLEESQENLRKLLLATTKDVRVIMIKLADRLHNMRTLGHLDPARRARIARESLDIFVPLADRLGMGQLKAEMEDLAFRYVHPEDYAELERRVRVQVRKSEHYMERARYAIRELLEAGGLKPLSVEGRHKHLYSVYKKLAKVDGDLEKIYDLTAIRIIVPDVTACYQALGLIHQQYKPLIYRIKDYIAVPKPNGYQSLHTTVFGLDGHIAEIQIRTPQMHEEAEHGLSAHFFYDAQKQSAAYRRGEGAAALPDKLKWVNDLAQLQQTTGDGPDFLEGAKLELFTDRIFVFSPKGDLYDLPEGSTALDFAFAVHSDLGLRTMGVKVNGRMVTLEYRLENRDVVEVLARREAAPNRDWLGFVRTSVARNRIRSWFRAGSRDANVASGRAALEAELRAWDKGRLEDVSKAVVAEALDSLHLRSVDDLYAGLGEGSLTVGAVIRRLWPDAARPASVPVVRREETTGRVLVGGEPLPYTLAPCCRPVFPQALMGYITRGAGVTVHALGCPNLPAEMERYVTCRWETLAQAPERLVCQLELVGMNRIGLLSDVTGVMAGRRLNISGLTSQRAEDTDNTLIRFGVEVPDLFALAELIRVLEQVPGVTGVRRR